MKPGFVVLNIYQGATYNDELLLKDAAGVPLDLTGKTARMQVRAYPGAPIILELTTENGRILPLDATGKIIFHISAVDTALLSTGGYDYGEWGFDLELVETVGLEEIVERPAYGVVYLWPETTT